MSEGLRTLQECVALLFAARPEDSRKLAALLDPTRPLTAEELCERWAVTAETRELQLQYLARLCRAWGLRPLKGRVGWNALYNRADVLHAEAFAGMKLTRRKKVGPGRKERA